MSDVDGSITADDGPHERISQLEARIDDLAERIERCRKIIVAAKIAIALGAVTLLLLLIGAVRFDPVVMMVAMIAFIGGIVVLGTNMSTAKQMAADLARAEALRSGLIDQLDLRPVADEADR
jgi:enoyl-CoA hydratase/carnithine racemase